MKVSIFLLLMTATAFLFSSNMVNNPPYFPSYYLVTSKNYSSLSKNIVYSTKEDESLSNFVLTDPYSGSAASSCGGHPLERIKLPYQKTLKTRADTPLQLSLGNIKLVLTIM
jgi:hypothetical protein